jgi:hypothetical protein
MPEPPLPVVPCINGICGAKFINTRLSYSCTAQRINKVILIPSPKFEEVILINFVKLCGISPNPEKKIAHTLVSLHAA